MKVISVPHTGTRFVVNLIRGAGVETVQQHTYDGNMWRVWLRDGEKAVIPLRDPVLCMISAINRMEQASWVDGFNQLLEWPLDHALFFRVDCPERERATEVAALYNYIGAAVPDTDWTPVGSEPDHLGLKRDYLATGTFPQAFTEKVHRTTRAFLRSHGYTMMWMES